MNDQLLPTRRRSVAGTDLDGNSVTLVFSISKKLYRCPGCYDYIPVGSEHVLVRIKDALGNSYHQHWHRDCAGSRYARELVNPRTVPA